MEARRAMRWRAESTKLSTKRSQALLTAGCEPTQATRCRQRARLTAHSSRGGSSVSLPRLLSSAGSSHVLRRVPTPQLCRQLTRPPTRSAALCFENCVV